MKAFIESTTAALARLAAALGVVASAAADDGWANVPLRPHDMVGTLACASASCHGSGHPRNLPGRSRQQEYLQWMSADPHALAGLRMQQPRFQEVLKRASRKTDGEAEAAIYERCARCHDPLGLAREDEASAEPGLARGGRGSAGASPSHSRWASGIGCESCHGGARGWLTAHYQRGISRERLSELGMVDTKNLLVRARLCAGCHVGSTENDVNHDLLAAGHPPLRFELASYQALIERKHWDDGPRRLAEPNYEVQLWAAGRIASAEAALALLEGRAKRAAATDETQMNTDESRSPWPEFAEYNCFACHQSLRPQVGKLTAGGTGDRGRSVPPWQMWNFALVPSLVSTRQIGEKELPPPGGSFADALGRIRGTMERSLTPPPEEVASFAVAARAALQEHVRISTTGAMLGPDDAPLGAGDLLNALAASDGGVTWEQACHELAALLAAERALRDQGHEPVPSRRERARRVGQALRFTSEEREWPAALPGAGPRPGTMSLEEIAAELKVVREELAQECLGTQY